MGPQARQLLDIAREAGAAILEVYRQDFAVQHKGDESPLTAADLASHRVITERLNTLTPDVPVLSEEGADIPSIPVAPGQGIGSSIRSTARESSSSATANSPSTSR
jgi:3'-phosphoadenosine 5'-phosphosulfate (PAPS) 3'-phosphatase